MDRQSKGQGSVNTELATPGLIHSAKHWTPKRRLEAGQSPGRRSGQTAGGRVLDLTDLQKAVMLCNSCIKKFPDKGTGYTQKPDLPFAAGRCDGCEQYTQRGVLLVHHKMARNL